MRMGMACGCVSRRGFLGGAAALAASGARAQEQPFRVDVHHHLYPPEWLARAGKVYNMLPVMTGWRVEHSLDQMDQAGIRTAMLSVATPGVYFGDVQEARQLARLCNEYGAGLVRDHPGRFGFFAMLPLPDIEGSLREIEYAMDTLKVDGIGLFTNYPDNIWLGNPKFAPVYEELNRRNAVVYTHPNTAACCTNLTPGIPDTVVEYGTSTTRAIATMVFGGFDRKYPDIKVIFSHAGGTMPYLIERFEFQATSGKYPQEMPEGVHPAIRHFLYDTAQSSNPEALGTLMKIVPASQIVFGTDYPYRTCVEHVVNLKKMDLPQADMQAIERGNAMRLMPQLG